MLTIAEYIERSDAAFFFENSKQTMWHKDDIAATISSKKNIPAADVVEVVRGRWIKRQFADEPTAFGYRCSECHLTYEVDTNYCPNCGAKMDGERRSDNEPT